MTLDNRLVYLAGPITGLSYGEARHGWREEFDRILHEVPNTEHIQCLSPMRGKDHLASLQCISGSAGQYDSNAMSSSSGIVCRDRFDVTRHSDVTVANFLGTKVASVGTCIEFGWAHAHNKPIIMIIEDDGKDIGNPHDHLMITDMAGYRVATLEAAAILLAHLLTPGI